MRICHVTDYLPGMHRIAGGAEHAVRRIIDEQVTMGLEIDVVTTKRDFPDPPAPGRKHFEIGILDRISPGAFFAWKNFFVPVDPRASIGLTRALRESRPDVVHFHNLHFSSLSVIGSAKRLGLPTILSIYDYWIFCPSFMLLTNDGRLCSRGHGHHCVDCMGTRRAQLLKPVKRALFGIRKPIVERLVARVDHFVVLSAESKRLLVRHGVFEDRVDVIPQYIWKEASERPLADGVVPGRLAYVGWVEARKGLHVVIEALGLLTRRKVDVHLQVLGLPASDAYRERIEGLIDRQGVRDRVQFRGKQSRDGLLRALDESFLVVIPEQWENMSPVVLTESMAAGKCVVAARTGGIPGFIRDMQSGLLVERDRPEEFAEKISWAVQHPDRVRSMGIAARQRARVMFDPDEINRRMLDLYRRCGGG